MTDIATQSFRDGRRAGFAMLVGLALGMVAANSPLADIYAIVHHLPLQVGAGTWAIEAPLIEWINQGLLTVFFFLIGLHTNHELTLGALSDPGAAFDATPIAAPAKLAVVSGSGVAALLGILSFKLRRSGQPSQRIPHLTPFGSTQGSQSHRRFIVANRKDADHAISRSPLRASTPARNRRCPVGTISPIPSDVKMTAEK